MQLIGYEDKYYDSVAECLRRNFVGIGSMCNNDFDRWFSPIINYAWLDSVRDIHPWTRGVVLLSDDAVVGYFGLLFSLQKTSNNPQQLYVNFTTWAIDDPYRIQVFSVINEILKIPNAIFTDYSACEVINGILTKFCHFQRIETHETVFFPLPNINFSLQYCKFTPTSHELSNNDILNNHIGCDVKAIKASYGKNDCVVYYKVTKHKVKNAVSLNRIFILSIDNIDLFSKFARAIVFKIQMIELGYLIIDSRFLGNREFKFLCKTRGITRLAFSADGNACISESNYLYSEFAALYDC